MLFPRLLGVICSFNLSLAVFEGIIMQKPSDIWPAVANFSFHFIS
jgi:hypothetical protein